LSNNLQKNALGRYVGVGRYCQTVSENSNTLTSLVHAGIKMSLHHYMKWTNKCRTNCKGRNSKR